MNEEPLRVILPIEVKKYTGSIRKLIYKGKVTCKVRISMEDQNITRLSIVMKRLLNTYKIKS